MCRWLAYSGNPIALDELIFKTPNSLIDQSLSARSSVTTTNGDGFGIGWYDDCKEPGVYKHIRPAWNDQNLRDLCHHVRSPMFLAHVRSATGTTIQRSNCHPFRYGRWLFLHNGRIRGYEHIRRAMAMALPEELFGAIGGTTDSELMFHLALSLGMEEDVPGGVARMVGMVERLGRERGIEHPLQMTLGIADGQRLYAFRYSSEGRTRTLYHSKSIAALRELLPPELRSRIEELSEDARVVVSEPLTDIHEPWHEIPESTWLSIEGSTFECAPFAPLPA